MAPDTPESGPASVDLTSAVVEHLAKARAAAHQRSAHLVLHDGALRQSVIALLAGSVLGEHEAPAAASVHVLHGGVRVTTVSGEELELSHGMLGSVPQERHDLVALQDSVILLTTVTGID
ncbi:cupin [Streptomyces sp. NPDC002851]